MQSSLFGLITRYKIRWTDLLHNVHLMQISDMATIKKKRWIWIIVVCSGAVIMERAIRKEKKEIRK